MCSIYFSAERGLFLSSVSILSIGIGQPLSKCWLTSLMVAGQLHRGHFVVGTFFVEFSFFGVK